MMTDSENSPPPRRLLSVGSVLLVALFLVCTPVAQGSVVGAGDGESIVTGAQSLDASATTTSSSTFQQVSSPEGTISLNTTSTPIAQGETFWLAVQYDTSVGDPGPEVSGIGYALTYNTTVLNGLAVEQGEFLTQDGQGSFTTVQQINDTTGTISYGEARTSSTGVTGSGNVTYVQFQVTSATDAPLGALVSLNFTNVQVSDPAGSSVPTAIENGTVDTIDPIDPTASFVATPQTANISENVTFDASASLDNYRIDTYAWEFGDGATEATDIPTTVHEYADTGTYQVNLTVTDGDGNTNTTTRTITIIDEEAPKANVTASPTVAEINETVVTLDGSETTDNDDVAYYEWDFDGDGDPDANTTSAVVTNVFTEPGDVTVRMTAYDPSGNSDTAETTVTRQDTTPPTAVLSVSDDTVVRSESVVLNASGSTDNHRIVEYRWDVDGDGAVDRTTTVPNTTVSFDELETVTVTVTVADASGNNATASATVSVENQPPTADAGADVRVEEGVVVQLDASNSTDPDDSDTLTFSWTQAVGPTVSLQDNLTATPSFTAPNVTNETTLTFEVTATDGNLSDTDVVNVTVVPTNDAPVADAGSDQTVNGTETVQLDGTGSADPNQDNLTYTWTQVAGPAVNLVDSDSATPTFVAPDVDTTIQVVFDLQVSDGILTDTDTVNITVEPRLTPANFSVTDLSAPASVTQGENVTVRANVTNLGDVEGTQTVDFRLDTDDNGTLEANETLAGETVALDSGVTQTVAFEVSTDSLAPGTYLHGVATENDSQTAQLNVTEAPLPANFSVTDLSTPASVTQGENVTVTANVTNTGGLEGTQDIAFRLDTDGDGTLDESETLASETTTLSSGETISVEFDVSTDGLDTGTYLHGVMTANDSQTAQLNITETTPPASFSVDGLDAPRTVTQGENVTVSANVTNTGGLEGTQTVEFRLDTDANGTLEDDEALASETVTLDRGATRSVAFEIPTDSLEPGTYLHGVVTANDSQTAQLDVTEPEPANFSVTTLSAPASTVQGENLAVTVGVTNVGDRSGSQSVDVRIDFDGNGVLGADETVANQTVTLGPGDSVEDVIEVSTEGFPTGTFAYGLVTENDTRTEELTLVPSSAAANFSVTDLSAPTSVTEGDTITVTANVTNVGGLEGTQTVDFRLDDGNGTLAADETLANRSITLTSGESQPVEFEVSTGDLDAGTYRHGIVTSNDSQTAQITVEALESSPTPTPTPEPSPPSGDDDDGGTAAFSSEVTEQDSGTVIEFSDATANRRYRIDLGDSVQSNNVTITGTEMFFDRSVNEGTIEFSASGSVPEDTQELAGALAYLSVETDDVSDDDLEEVEIEFTIPLSVLDEQDIDTEDVQLYRFEDGQWMAYETSHEGDGEFMADEIPGYSVFAIGPAGATEAAAQQTATATPESTATPTPEPETATPEPTATETPEPTETETETPAPEPTDTTTPAAEQTTSTQFPGFTPVLTMIAVFLAGLIAARRSRR